MQKLFRILTVIGLSFAATARASELSIEFASGDPVNATVQVGDSVLVNVLWTQDADEASNFGLGGYAFSLTGAAQNHNGTTATPDRVENDALFLTANTPANGFSDGGVMGTVGGNMSYVAGFASGPASSINGAVTDLVLGSFELRADAEGVHEFYIFRNASLLAPDMAGASGQTLSFANIPDAYNEYSIGTGFAGRNDGSDALPLTVTVTAASTGGGGGGGGGTGGGTDDGGTDDGGTDDGGTDDGTGDGGTDDGGDTGTDDGGMDDGSGDDGGMDGGTDGGTGMDDSDGTGDDGGSDDGGNNDGGADDGSGGQDDSGQGNNGGDDSGGSNNSGNTGGGFCAVGMTSTTMSILSGLAMMWGVTRPNRYRRRI